MSSICEFKHFTRGSQPFAAFQDPVLLIFRCVASVPTLKERGSPSDLAQHEKISALGAPLGVREQRLSGGSDVERASAVSLTRLTLPRPRCYEAPQALHVVSFWPKPDATWRSVATLVRLRSSLWWCLACAPRPQCYTAANQLRSVAGFCPEDDTAAAFWRPLES